MMKKEERITGKGRVYSLGASTYRGHIAEGTRESEKPWKCEILQGDRGGRKEAARELARRSKAGGMASQKILLREPRRRRREGGSRFFPFTRTSLSGNGNR